jgi:hypothetical protein
MLMQSALINFRLRQREMGAALDKCNATNSHSASQEIPCLLWKLKVHYSVQNSPPLVPTLSQISQVHIFPYCARISHIFHACYTPRLSYPPLFDHSNNIW